MRRTARSRTAILTALALALLLAACGGGGAGGTPGDSSGGAGGVAAPNKVTISNFAFSPANVEVKTGTEVTWTNEDSASHTVVADDGAFKSPTMEAGKSYSFTFSKAGTYKYHCSIHPSMVAQVVVK